MHPLTSFGWSDRVAGLYTDAASDGATEPGRVVRSDRGVHAVALAGGVSPIPSHPDLGEQPVTGDWGVVTTDDYGNKWLHDLLPRWSSLSRADPEGITAEQVLCANVDVLAVVTALDRGVRPNAIERMLSVAWSSGAVPVVVLTKADTSNDLAEDVATAIAASGGVDVVVTSARNDVGIDDVRALVTEGRTLALLGQSGAGKSTLVNALVGQEVRAVADVRASDSRGRHTTTARELVPLPGGGVLLDTPGIRTLGLWDAEGVASSFADIEELAQGCHFNDCGHNSEPGCAVREAVADGSLEERRFTSYRKLAREVEAMGLRQDAVARRRASKKGPRPR